MSAWITEARHIDLIVAALVRSEIAPEAGIDRDVIGRVLWQENHHSVNHRYDESTPMPYYTYTAIELPDLSTLAGTYYLRQAVASYSYQSCEHPGWHDSIAAAWTNALTEHLERHLRELGATHTQFNGWSFPGSDMLAGWSVDETYAPDQLTRA